MALNKGWGILATMTGILASILALQTVRLGVGDPLLLQSIRWTARLSFPCFILAWTASSLHHIWPTPWSRWQLKQRRFLGITFAILHLIHLAFIATAAFLSSGQSLAGRPWLDFAGGGLAYVFLVLMLATSFPKTARVLPRNQWIGLHTVGGYLLATIFSISYGFRAASDPVFLPQAAVLVAAFALRLGRRMSLGGRNRGKRHLEWN